MLSKIVGYPPGYTGTVAAIATSGMSLHDGYTKNPTSSIYVLASSVANVGSTISIPAKNSKAL